MTPKKTTEPRDEDGLGVLDESASLDTTGIGILPGTAQVSVALPQDDDDDLVDDDVIADEDAFSELILDERVVIEPVLAGEIGRINEETADIIIELPAEPREEATVVDEPPVASEVSAELADQIAEPTQTEQDAPAVTSPKPKKKKSRLKAPKLGKAAIVEPEPVVEPELEPELDPALVGESEPVVDAEPLLEAEPIVESESVLEAEPVVESEPAVEPALVGEPELVVEAEPSATVELEDDLAAEPTFESSDATAEPDLALDSVDDSPAEPLAAEEVTTPTEDAVPSSVVEHEVSDTEAEERLTIDEAPTDQVEEAPADDVEPAPISEAHAVVEIEPALEPEAVEEPLAEAEAEAEAAVAVEEPAADATADADAAQAETPAVAQDAVAQEAAADGDDDAEEFERIESIEALLAAADVSHEESATHHDPEVPVLAPASPEISDDNSRQGSAESAPAPKETVSAVTTPEDDDRALAPRNSAQAVRAARPEMTLTSKRLGELSEPSRESADLLTADRLLDPNQITKPEPEGTWAHFLYTVSGRKINIGDGKRARARKELSARIAAPLLGGARFVPVLSRKGGVGKTTITTLLGMALADAREDRVIAVDANPDRGTLADRIPRSNNKSVRDLVRVHEDIKGYHDVSAIVARDATRLDVLASDSDPRIAEAFSDDDYRDVAEVAARYYSLVLTDTGTGIVHSVMGATLDLSDQLIIVSGLSVDEARLASETLTWLESNGYAEQARDAIVVLNQSTPGVPLVRLNELEEHFATRTKRVVRVPYDAQIAGGGAIVFANLQPETRQAARELAAHLVEGLRARTV